MQLQLRTTTSTPPPTPPVHTVAAATPGVAGEPAPVPVPVPSAAPVPLADATFAQKLLGKIGASQQRAVEGQQLLGAVTSVLGQRLSMIGSNVWHLLRGDSAEQAAG